MFIVETSRGALAGLSGGQWFGAKYSSTLAQARADLAETFADKLTAEDRGEEYEREWSALAERARGADIGDVLSFDEFAARIVEDAEAESIGDRFPPCHNPELRWIPGDYDSLHIESGLSPLSDDEETVCKFMGVDDFCDRAGDCSPETILTDAEWSAVLRSMAEG